MRTYHRWLSVLFGLFILFIAVTGVVTQGARLYASGEAERARAAAPAGAVPVPAARPPEAARPPQTPLRKFTHFVTELHSGEEFGIVGQLVSMVSGIALIFFAFSGLYMYIQMYRRRSHRHSHPKRLFWP